MEAEVKEVLPRKAEQESDRGEYREVEEPGDYGIHDFPKQHPEATPQTIQRMEKGGADQGDRQEGSTHN